MAKRSAQGSGNIYRRKDGRWEARFYVGIDPATGKGERRSIYCTTQKEAQERLTSALNDVNNGIYADPSKLTVGEWLDTWATDYMDDKKHGTVKAYKAMVNTHLKPCIGGLKLSTLSVAQLNKFYKTLSTTGKTVRRKDPKTGKVIVKKEPMAPKSVHNVHVVLHKALSVAEDLGLIQKNPCDNHSVMLPRNQQKEISPLTDEQVKDLLTVCDTDPYGDVYKILLFTGLRIGEALGLTWDCIDFDAGIITVNKQLQKRPVKDGGYTYASLKNDKPRTLAPASYVMQVLKARKVKQAQDRLKAGTAWQAWSTPEQQKKAAVFTNELGGYLSDKRLYIHLKSIAPQFNAPDVRIHDLRHTYAVLSLQNGDDVKTVQGNLGHATAAFTLDRYGHVSEKMRTDSADRMQKYIENI